MNEKCPAKSSKQSLAHRYQASDTLNETMRFRESERKFGPKEKVPAGCVNYETGERLHTQQMKVITYQ